MAEPVPAKPGPDGAGQFAVMRGQKRVEDARRRAGVPRAAAPAVVQAYAPR